MQTHFHPSTTYLYRRAAQRSTKHKWNNRVFFCKRASFFVPHYVYFLSQDITKKEMKLVSVVVRHVIWHLETTELHLGYNKRSQVYNHTQGSLFHPDIKVRTALSPDAHDQLSTHRRIKSHRVSVFHSDVMTSVQYSHVIIISGLFNVLSVSVCRFSVSCTKRITMLRAGRWGHRPVGRRGRPPSRVNGASREHFLRQVSSVSDLLQILRRTAEVLQGSLVLWDQLLSEEQLHLTGEALKETPFSWTHFVLL